MSQFEQISPLAGVSNSDAKARVLQYLRETGAGSAAEIARATQLAKSTIARVVGELKQAGTIVERAQPGPAGRGRPGTTLTLSPEAGNCLGILFGPHSVMVALADVSHELIGQHEQDLGPDYPVDAGVEAVARLTERLYAESGLDRRRMLGAAFALPGPVEPRTRQLGRSSITPVWTGTRILEAFSPILTAPIRVENEANCAALAELMWGAGRGESDFFYYKLDVGVGGAVVANGDLLRGIAGGAGEVGHMIMDPNGSLCRCGNRGCLETMAGWHAVIDPARRLLGQDVQFADIVELARGGHDGCRRLIADVARIAGQALAHVAAVLNPPLVILGGLQTTAGDLLLEPLMQSFEEHAMIKSASLDPAARTRFEFARFQGNHAMVLGAIALALRGP